VNAHRLTLLQNEQSSAMVADGVVPEVRAEEAPGRASSPLTPLCVDADGLAILLGISPRSVYRLNDAGRIPAPIDLGSSRRWFVEEILAWLRAGSPRRRQWVAMRGKAS
jgi:predicted DNA-binding transcriptional regulator AlpA